MDLPLTTLQSLIFYQKTHKNPKKFHNPLKFIQLFPQTTIQSTSNFQEILPLPPSKKNMNQFFIYTKKNKKKFFPVDQEISQVSPHILMHITRLSG